MRRLVPLLGGLSLAACATAPPAAAPVPVERRLMMMGTSLEITVEATDRERALAASERAVAALEAAEARLSTWREDTELARLNRAAVGEPQPISIRLFSDLGTALGCWQETGGAFDPAIGALIQAWDLRGAGRRPGPEEIRAALAQSGMDGLRLTATTAARERPGLVLEEGGFGKGAGLADAMKGLRLDSAVIRATLDLGGQVAVFERDSAVDRAQAWTIPVADPRQRDRPVVALSIHHGSVSTSGNSERGIQVDGVRLGHILDPRTGEPAPDFGSLTVWAEDALRADCLSTGLYVLGPEAALAWAASRPGIQVLVLRPRGESGRLEALASAGLRGRLEPLVDGVEIRFWQEGPAPQGAGR